MYTKSLSKNYTKSDLPAPCPPSLAQSSIDTRTFTFDLPATARYPLSSLVFPSQYYFKVPTNLENLENTGNLKYLQKFKENSGKFEFLEKNLENSGKMQYI